MVRIVRKGSRRVAHLGAPRNANHYCRRDQAGDRRAPTHETHPGLLARHLRPRATSAACWRWRGTWCESSPRCRCWSSPARRCCMRSASRRASTTSSCPACRATSQGRYGVALAAICRCDETVRLRANLIRQRDRSTSSPTWSWSTRSPSASRTSSPARCERAAGARRTGRALVLLLRDILDSAEATTPRLAARTATSRRSSAYYDQVLVVGSPEVFDLRREYDFPPLRRGQGALLRLHRARSRGRAHARARCARQLGVGADEPLRAGHRRAAARTATRLVSHAASRRWRDAAARASARARTSSAAPR